MAPSMSLKLVWLKMLYISHRSWICRFSLKLIFLKNARSLLKIDGRRPKFLPILPRSPSRAGTAKHVGLIARGVPCESTPLGFLLGSHSTTGTALMLPPVKSVIPVQVAVFALTAVRYVPPGHCWLALMVTVPPL